VYRAEILRLSGEWPAAMAEARQACDRLAGGPAAGAAWYQRAELHRHRGEYSEAEAAYRVVSDAGEDPHPGLALLWVATGRVDAAAAAMRRLRAPGLPTASLPAVLAASVEVALAAGDVATAEAAATELGRAAAALDGSYLQALALRSHGAVLLAKGEAESACAVLRESLPLWRGLAAPYEIARVQVLIGYACRAAGDDGTAGIELGAASATFARLGAPDDRIVISGSVSVGGLTEREREVLALVASGASNREVAAELVLSEHTVRRHLQNIFAKLDVSSRAAATAWAFRHGLV
jgi:DNA-binding CsgD family transcriptional regulator